MREEREKRQIEIDCRMNLEQISNVDKTNPKASIKLSIEALEITLSKFSPKLF